MPMNLCFSPLSDRRSKLRRRIAMQSFSLGAEGHSPGDRIRVD